MRVRVTSLGFGTEVSLALSCSCLAHGQAGLYILSLVSFLHVSYHTYVSSCTPARLISCTHGAFPAMLSGSRKAMTVGAFIIPSDYMVACVMVELRR